MGFKDELKPTAELNYLEYALDTIDLTARHRRTKWDSNDDIEAGNKTFQSRITGQQV